MPSTAWIESASFTSVRSPAGGAGGGLDLVGPVDFWESIDIPARLFRLEVSVMMTIPQAFQEFLSAIELASTTKEDEAIRQHIYLREALQKRLPVDKSLLSGSYARRTAITPLNDIDVFLVLRRTDGYHTGLRPIQILAKLQGAIEEIYPGKTAVVQSRSVNVQFTGSGIAFDVVPAFSESETVYIIPERETDSWIRTNPEEHKRLAVEANERAGGKLKPLIKAIKRANYEHRDEDGRKPMRSFHLEVLTWGILTYEPKDYIEGLLVLFEALEQRVCNPCPDPAGLGPDIQPSKERCDKARAWLADILRLARDADQLRRDGHTGRAHAKLREIFGREWPEKGSHAPTSPAGPAIITGGDGPDDSRSRFG